MAIKQWGTGMLVVAFLAGALTVGAFAAASSSFNQGDVACGAPVSAALHGKQVVRLDDGSSSILEVVTPQNRRFFTEPLVAPGGFVFRPQNILTVCKQPARGRLLIAVVFLAAAVLGVAFMTRRSSTLTDDELEPEPGPVPA